MSKIKQPNEAAPEESTPAPTHEAPTLDLAAPRTIVLKSGDKHFTWHFRRLTLDDWTMYFHGIVHQTLNTPTGREEVFETETAQLELVDRTAIGVGGYGDLKNVKNWRLALPIHHRLAVGTVLRNVGCGRDKKAELLLSDFTEVSLSAAWSVDDGGKMTLYSSLIHRFRQPSIAQMKKFNFESARVRVSGTQENGVTTYPARQAIAMKIYDELIESVDGYSVHGSPLTDVATIRSEMDGAHKAEAALQLFIPDAPVAVE